MSSSEASTRLLAEAGIEVKSLNDTGDLALYVDGADEATRHLALVKGGGGALTRDKIVAAASRRSSWRFASTVETAAGETPTCAAIVCTVTGRFSPRAMSRDSAPSRPPPQVATESKHMQLRDLG